MEVKRFHLALAINKLDGSENPILDKSPRKSNVERKVVPYTRLLYLEMPNGLYTLVMEGNRSILNVDNMFDL